MLHTIFHVIEYVIGVDSDMNPIQQITVGSMYNGIKQEYGYPIDAR